MSAYSFILPHDFDDYEWEVTAKGYFSWARIIVSGKQYSLNFNDAVRLNQEIESSFGSDDVFFEPNLVVVLSVTKLEIEEAVEQLVLSNRLILLTPK